MQTSAQSNPSDREKHSVFQVMRRDFAYIFGVALDFITLFVQELFKTTRTHGWLRRWLFISVNGYLWAWFAFRANPIEFGENPLNDLVTYPFYALFAAETFRHVIVAALIFWLSLRIAASYLDDVFELGDLQVAEKYILQAAFASRYDSIAINDAKIAPKHRKSPIALIGGPGKVGVHLENAVLFENMNGEPILIGPDSKNAELRRFDRLRAVLDLRDQVDEFEVSARTRDGILVTATGVRVKYSVYRGGQPATLKLPHPYHRGSIQELVYEQRVFKPLRYQSSPPDEQRMCMISSDEILDMRSFIQAEMKKFISQSNLIEFLATTRLLEAMKSREEKEQLLKRVRELRPEAQVDEDELNGNEFVLTDELGHFVPRAELTDNFYKTVASKTIQEVGLELHWIDVGTWVLPEKARSIPEQHFEAWRLTLENLADRRLENLQQVQAESQTDALMASLRQIVEIYDAQSGKADPNGAVSTLLEVFFEQLKNARGLYQQHSGGDAQRLERVYKHVGAVAGEFDFAKPSKLE